MANYEMDIAEVAKDYRRTAKYKLPKDVWKYNWQDEDYLEKPFQLPAETIPNYKACQYIKPTRQRL